MDMEIKEKTDSRLILCRGPTSRAWALLGGFTTIALGAAISGYESIIWKLTYLAAVVLAISYMDEYEECSIDKTTGRIEVCQESILQRYILKYFQQTPKVVANVSELEDVIVEEDIVSERKAYHVILKFTNYSLAVSQTAVVGDGSAQEKSAECIRKFLGMAPAPPLVSQSTNQDRPSELPLSSSDDVVEAGDSSGTSSDEGFEKVDKSDLLDSPTDLLDTPPSVDTPSVGDTPPDNFQPEGGVTHD